MGIADKASNLKCHYSFDEDVENLIMFHDESGNFYHTNNIVDVTLVEGRCGTSAVHFNGTSSKIESNFPIGTWLPTEERSISLWIKPYDNVARNIVGAASYTWQFRRNANGTIQFIYWNASEADSLYITGGYTPLNQWSHIVFTWDGTSLKLYVNEIYIGSASHTKDTYRTTTQKTNIGGNIYTWGANAFFYGDIDDIRFYDCALTQEEVHQLYSVAAIFDINNEYYTGDFDEQKPSHWWSGKDTIENNLWVDRVGSLNWVLANGFVKNSDNIALNGKVGINATMSHVGVNFGTYWHCVIEYELITNETNPFVIDFGSVTGVPANCSAIGLNGKTRSVNSKIDGNNSKGPGASSTELSPNIRSIVEFGVCPGLSPNTSRTYRVIDFGEIVYGSEFSETTTDGSRLWNSWGNNFYLASGVAGNNYGSNAKIYDIKIYENDEIRWQVTPNKITYSKEFKEVDGTTKMMPDGSLYSTTFKEV